MKCPCEECISLAICVNNEKIKCELLCNYLDDFNFINECKALSIHKAYMFHTMLDKDIEFIKDKDVSKQIAYDDKYVRGQPIRGKIKHYTMYWSARGMILVFRWIRYVKYSWKLIRWNTNED